MSSIEGGGFSSFIFLLHVETSWELNASHEWESSSSIIPRTGSLGSE